MSSDLAKVGDKFGVRFKGSTIVLTKTSDMSSRTTNHTIEAYGSNKKAISPLISLMGTLALMGFPREVQGNLAGTYEAKIINGDIEFDLDKELKK